MTRPTSERRRRQKIRRRNAELRRERKQLALLSAAEEEYRLDQRVRNFTQQTISHKQMLAALSSRSASAAAAKFIGMLDYDRKRSRMDTFEILLGLCFGANAGVASIAEAHHAGNRLITEPDEGRAKSVSKLISELPKEKAVESLYSLLKAVGYGGTVYDFYKSMTGATYQRPNAGAPQGPQLNAANTWIHDPQGQTRKPGSHRSPK